MRRQGLTSTGERPFGETSDDDDDEEAASNGGSDAEAEAPADELKRIKLGLRSAKFPKTKWIKVRPTMSCGSIVQHYLRVMEVKGDGGGNVRLSLDGEELDPDSIIGDADLDEDDDEALMDIVGL